MRTLKVGIIAFFFVIFGAFFVLAPAMADPVAGLDEDLIPQFSINLNMEYCWDGTSCGSTTVRLYLNRTFVTDDGGQGSWAYDKSTGELQLAYTTGCSPLYIGYRVRRLIWEGTMTCQDGTGAQGTWTAVLSGFGPRSMSPADAGTSSSPKFEE